jgi:hypothetical protein
MRTAVAIVPTATEAIVADVQQQASENCQRVAVSPQETLAAPEAVVSIGIGHLWRRSERVYAHRPIKEACMPRRSPNAGELDELLLNAQLRDELEPFYDDSLDLLNGRQMPTEEENEFLASMLAWERAPVLPISQWFDPPLALPAPESLDDAQLRHVLYETVKRLYGQRIVIEHSDHLSDRQLYCVIYRDILPAYEKKLEPPRHYLRWSCVDAKNDPDLWLRFYASQADREMYTLETGEPCPPAETPPHVRDLPSWAD